MKLLRVMKMGKVIENLEMRFMVARKLVQGIKLLLKTALIAHLLATVWAWVGRAPGAEIFETQSWIAAYGCAEASIETQYVAALYWSLTTLTTVGYGDVLPVTDGERIFCMLAMC